MQNTLVYVQVAPCKVLHPSLPYLSHQWFLQLSRTGSAVKLLTSHSFQASLALVPFCLLCQRSHTQRWISSGFAGYCCCCLGLSQVRRTCLTAHPVRSYCNQVSSDRGPVVDADAVELKHDRQFMHMGGDWPWARPTDQRQECHFHGRVAQQQNHSRMAVSLEGVSRVGRLQPTITMNSCDPQEGDMARLSIQLHKSIFFPPYGGEILSGE